MDTNFTGGYIYCLTIMSELYDYKCYIGQHHTSEYGIVDDYWGSGTQWQNVREECDKQNIVINKDILCFCETKAEMDRMEKFWIAQFDAANDLFGYNLTAGGGGSVGLIQSAETRRKKSDAQKGEKSAWYGKHHSEESKKKISDALKGRKNPNFGKHYTLSAETKRKMSDSRKGRKSPNFSKQLSEETKQKMSEAKKGEKNIWFAKHLPAETRRKLSEKMTKYEIIVYKDNTEVARLRGHAAIENYFGNKSSSSVVYACCRGKRKSYKGYTFRKELWRY